MSRAAADHPALAGALCAIAREAGAAIMAVCAGDFAVRRKDDCSPVTEADHRAEAIITPALQRLEPAIPVVAEEAMAAGGAVDVSGGQFWLVDPLDGTKEFVARRDEFTVNIALIENGVPVLGVVYAPARDDLFAAHGRGSAWRETRGGAPRPIAARRVPAGGGIVLSSRSHGDASEITRMLAGLPVAGQAICGSSLKFCLLAAGEADYYPRYGPTSEWDTAAGHAVLAAAGGSVRTPDGTPLGYGKQHFLNASFIARGRDD